MGLGLGLGLSLSTYGPIVLYVGAIAAFLLSIFWKPEIGLYYLVPLLPMQTARYWLHAYLFGEKLVDVVLLGILLGLLFHGDRKKFISSPINWVLIAFMTLTYLSLWQGALYLGGSLPISYLDPRFSDWKNYVEMMCLFFVAAAVIRTRKQMAIVLALMCLSILGVNRNYHSTVGNRDYSAYSDDLRDAGTMGYAGENGMGAFQAGCAVFLIGLAAFAEKRLVKIGLWLVAGTSIYCLALTFSRGGYLGFLAGILVLGLVKQRQLLIALAILLFAWKAFVPTAVEQRVSMTYQDGQGLDSSAQERVTIWEDAMEVVHEDPVFGTGFDTYKFMGRVGPYNDTHNYYLKILLELGVVGFFAFLWMLRAAFQMSWRLYRSAKDPFLEAIGCAFFCMFVCAVVVNCFGDRWSYLQVNGFLWVSLGMVARGLILTQQERVEPENEAAESAAAAAAPELSHA